MSKGIFVFILLLIVLFLNVNALTEINILDKEFEPKELNITQGTTVKWINAAQTIHVLAGDVKSPRLEEGDSFDYTFEEVGEYSVIDVVSKARIKIIVTEAPEEEIVEEEEPEVLEEEPKEEIIEEDEPEEEVIPEEVEEEPEQDAVVIVIQETEFVDLETKATDPDADELDYIFTAPLNEEGKWQTTYGDAGEYAVIVTVSDGELSSSEDVLLIVEKKEESPVIDSFSPAEEELNIDEGDSILFRISASDLNKDELSYIWELDGEKVSETNRFDYSTDYKSEGDYLLKVYVADGKLTTTKEWNVFVENVDRKPIFMPITNILIKENQRVTIYLDATDPDDDEIAYSAENLPDGASLNGNVFTWYPGYDAVTKQGIVDSVLDKYHLVMDSYSVIFTAKGMEKEVKQDVRITILDVNRAPVLSSIGDIEVIEEDEFTIKATASDPDGDELRFSYSGWINTGTHQAHYGDAGVYYVNVTVSDGWLKDTKQVKIIVKKNNRAPVFREIRDYVVDEGELLRIKLRANDADGDEIVFSVENLTGASIDGNIFEWKVPYDITIRDSKEVRVEFTASDGEADAVQDAIVIVNHINLGPEIFSTSPEKEITVNKGEAVVFEVDADDFDGDSLSYKWVFGLFERYDEYGNKMRRVFSSAGNKKVKVVVSDGKEKVSYEWSVKVI